MTGQFKWISFLSTDTVADSEVFNITLGFFLPDVELLNVTFSTGVMSVDEANAVGFNVQEHLFNNGSKAFSIEVPFSDPAVLRTVSVAAQTYRSELADLHQVLGSSQGVEKMYFVLI